METSPFSAPFSWGTREARGRCSQGERVLYGRDLCRSGGTGKAEAAKLPGAGIWPEQCPGKCVAEKGRVAKSVRIGDEEQDLSETGSVNDFLEFRFRPPEVLDLAVQSSCRVACLVQKRASVIVYADPEVRFSVAD